MHLKTVAISLVATSGLLLGLACGDDDGSTSSQGGTTTTTTNTGGGVAAGGQNAGGNGGSVGVGGSGGSTGVGGGGAGQGAYVHVVPSDVGVNLGPGVLAAEPTAVYDGPTTITSPTTIENVIINGCLRIESNDVILRNIIVNCGGLYPIRAEGGTGATLEYSRVNCTSQSKAFFVQNYQNLTVFRNEIMGCEDFFFIAGDVAGLEVNYNYMHGLNLDANSHADGFQIGEASPTTGSIHIQGNWIGAEANGGKTDILFATNQSAAQILIEDNFLRQWGRQTLRCGGATTSCTARHNVYDQAFESLYASGDPNVKVLLYNGSSAGQHEFICNRLADGTLLEETLENTDRVGGADHVVAGCPAFP